MPAACAASSPAMLAARVTSVAMLVIAVAAAVRGAPTPPPFQDQDWLVAPRDAFPASEIRENVCWAEYGDGVCGIEMSNGLTTRRFVVTSDGTFGTVDWLLNATLRRGGLQSMIRALQPEAVVTIAGNYYFVGGLTQDLSTSIRAYRNRTNLAAQIASTPANITFSYVGHRLQKPTAPFKWTPGTRHSVAAANWPPKGQTLAVDFAMKTAGTAMSVPAAELEALKVTLYFEMYDGVPIISKWMTITSTADTDVVIDGVTVENFAAMPRFGAYLTHGSAGPGEMGRLGQPSQQVATTRPLLRFATDQAHSTACAWVDDYDATPAGLVPDCPSCRDNGATEPLLQCNYTIGPGAHVSASEDFISFRSLALATDSTDLERATLSQRRLTQLLAPHTTENPIFFHATNVSNAGFRHAVDQMAEVGFEMLIFSFGSGFNLESTDAAYLKTIKEQIAYANQRGIEVGGYDLIALERGKGGYGKYVGDKFVQVDAATGQLKPNACFASGWYDELYGLIMDFVNTTGLAMLETDGPYGGGDCASKDHAHHHGEEDSVYKQTQLQSAMYAQLRSMNVYVNQPDNYYFQGGNRGGMGYDENQYSLPRWHDLSISRMGMYDDLYGNLPTQGWMFVPIDQYHAGGASASFAGHAEELEWAFAQYLGAGTAACYRGGQLWDNTTATGQKIKGMIKSWVDFYKAHRETIIQPVVHLRRPDMQDWDGWLHVNPQSSTHEVGVALLFNPTDTTLEAQPVRIPLYYTGLDDAAVVSVDGAPPKRLALDRDYAVILSVTMPPRSIHTVVVERP